MWLERSSDEITWESAENVSKELIEEYEKEHIEGDGEAQIPATGPKEHIEVDDEVQNPVTGPEAKKRKIDTESKSQG